MNTSQLQMFFSPKYTVFSQRSVKLYYFLNKSRRFPIGLIYILCFSIFFLEKKAVNNSSYNRSCNRGNPEQP